MVATVYSAALWWDSAAILAIMREDNLDAEVAKGETELDCFGLVNKTVKRLATGYEPQGVTIKADDVMAQIAEVGYGNMAATTGSTLLSSGSLCRRPKATCCAIVYFRFATVESPLVQRLTLMSPCYTQRSIRGPKLFFSWRLTALSC